MIEAKIIKDSIYNGHRLTTLELEYPRYIHSEFMTHRVFSRNAQSSRAIPINTVIDRVINSNWYPIFMENKKGMAADIKLEGIELVKAKQMWDMSKLQAVHYATRLADAGIHKQIVNRILEPYSTIKTIVSATEWDNFFKLRISGDAQQEICELATKIRDAMSNSKPREISISEWHLPYITDEEVANLPIGILLKVSVARCARVSYLNHDKQLDYKLDEELHDQLLEHRHLSPFEHVAGTGAIEVPSNFVGWVQYRQMVEVK